MKRLTILTFLLTVALSSCGSAGTTVNNPTAAQETAAPAEPKSTQASGAGKHRNAQADHHKAQDFPEVTGFGATESAWNATHTADHEGKLDPTAVYNPNPSLPEVNGHMGSEYTSVLYTDGHVTGYEYHTVGTPIGAIKESVLRQQFPSD